MAASSSSSNVRTWRTTFLTLRDETLKASPKSNSKSIPQLLQNVIFSNSRSLISSASDLPPHEVTSGLLFLVELASNSTKHVPAQDLHHTFSHITSLMYEICQCPRVRLQLNSSSWKLILEFSSNLLHLFLSEDVPTTLDAPNAST